MPRKEIVCNATCVQLLDRFVRASPVCSLAVPDPFTSGIAQAPCRRKRFDRQLEDVLSLVLVPKQRDVPDMEVVVPSTVAEAVMKQQTRKSRKSMIRENKNAKIAKVGDPQKFNPAKIKAYTVTFHAYISSILNFTRISVNQSTNLAYITNIPHH